MSQQISIPRRTFERLIVSARLLETALSTTEYVQSEQVRQILRHLSLVVIDAEQYIRDERLKDELHKLKAG